MGVIDIQYRVETAIAEEKQARQLTNYLESYLKLDPEFVRAVVKFIVRYIRTSPILLAETGKAARREGIIKEFTPILKEAASYWERERGVVPAPGKLIRLADQAYLTRAFVQFAGQTYKGATGRQLLSHNLHQSNLAMRQLLGSENTAVLDGLVDEGMWRRPVRAAIRELEDWGGTLDLSPAIGRAAFAVPQATREILLQAAEPIIGPPSHAKQEIEGGFRYRVWYATNRRPRVEDHASQGFRNEPDINNHVRYGICYVFVPKCHKPGSLGTSWAKRWITLRFKDDHLKLTSQESFSDAKAFFASLSVQIAAQPKELRHLLVYIHGFDVSFKGAALRAAQIGADLEVPGETVFFSWPSHANSLYVPDQKRIDNSETPLRDFLIGVVRKAKAEAVHVVAHSMGNRGLIRVADALRGCGVKFANLILAAPDVDQDFFREHAVVYPSIADRTTLYASPRDLALKLASSKLLGDGPRAGLTPPITIVPCIDTVQVTQFNLFDFGHGYWAQARELIVDIYQLMKYAAAPPRALLHEERTKDKEKDRYWILQ
ncbi:MAG TPA: alpha/beta hydrolase [Candidatus Sulfotelmatobacter sp.]|jgi:esterase/lipase superfamily enzyme|nr:alpha/beta hydrolase [Candidatus Sulfotelmatobacter sp.]